MKDTMNCPHTLSSDVVYKEVVIIGNGPSGMVTSFMLAGNVPYLKEVPEDLPIDEMLKARLSNLPKGQSLYEADLMELAEGLEGRSQNPIPLLMDNLMRPCADLGIHSDSLIEWRYEAEKQVDHVVLGRGRAGGAWHTFPRGVRTLSPAAWLRLPPHAALAADATRRLSAAAVARYCRRYVASCGLTQYFRSGVVVTSVRRAPRRGTTTACSPRCPLAALYWVCGYDTWSGRGFRYACRRVVVACGASDRPNALPAHFTSTTINTLTAYERALASEGGGGVLVVGSGLSAADAVAAGARAARPLAHLHRAHAHAHALAALSPQLYPDYAQVYKMMRDGTSEDYPLYKSYPEHVIVDITPLDVTSKPMTLDSEVDYETIRPKRVKLLNLVTNETTDITVSIIAVFIGSKPDLFFLQTNFNLNSIELEQDCIKCTNEKKAKKKIEDERRQCFLRNHWHYIKSVLGQSIQSCKSRYLNYTEINGNSDTKCTLPDCNKRPEKTKCTCDEIKTDDCKYEIIPSDNKCQCQLINPYSDGLGFGIDPKKPVDSRSNPIAIDKGTHELLNAPKGIYALGPLTGDNFVRFIPGGALAIVSHIHRHRKITD